MSWALCSLSLQVLLALSHSGTLFKVVLLLGTTSINEVLTTFKSGAFIPGKAVQPLALNYPHCHCDLFVGSFIGTWSLLCFLIWLLYLTARALFFRRGKCYHSLQNALPKRLTQLVLVELNWTFTSRIKMDQLGVGWVHRNWALVCAKCEWQESWTGSQWNRTEIRQRDVLKNKNWTGANKTAATEKKMGTRLAK